mgnify:CR=1 FL=1
MNTVTAYANRAKAARNAARELFAEGAPFTRLQDVRAAHLADYARRCEELANIVDGDRVTQAFRDAGDYADETHQIWFDLRTSRRLGVVLSYDS